MAAPVQPTPLGDAVPHHELQSTLLHTYHPDLALRQHAERALNAYVTTGQALFTLLRVVADPTAQAREVRQAAAIVVKNRIYALWREPLPDDIPAEQAKPCLLNPQEKAQARAALVDVLLAETDTSLRGMVAEAFKTVADFDYPARWPDLVPALVAQVSSSRCGCMAQAPLSRLDCKRCSCKPRTPCAFSTR